MPGEAGIWVLIGGDLVVFSLFFATFLFYRGEDPATFRSAQLQLNQGFGALNTLLMLSSSWFVATAVRAARSGRRRPAGLGLLLAMACGLGFVASKFFEYREKLHAGITPATNDFFMYYFVFTGIHAVHVLAGMGALLFVARQVASRPLESRTLRNIESGASFWHLVDLLWIVLFALLYLLH